MDNCVLQQLPKVLRPPFKWNLSLPPAWAYLDTRPEHLLSSIDLIIKEFYLPLGYPSEKADFLAEKLKQTAEVSKQRNALITLLLPEITSSGKVDTASIDIQWRNTAPNQASIETISRSVEKSENGADYEEILSPRKIRYGVLTWKEGTLPQISALYPLASTTWTLVVTGRASGPDIFEPVENMVKHIVESCRFNPETTAILNR